MGRGAPPAGGWLRVDLAALSNLGYVKNTYLSLFFFYKPAAALRTELQTEGARKSGEKRKSASRKTCFSNSQHFPGEAPREVLAANRLTRHGAVWR